MLRINISNIVIIVVKNVDYHCTMYNISKSEVIKNEVKKLPYLLRYVPDQYKTQRMCDKVVLESSGTLNFVPDCYKN